MLLWIAVPPHFRCPKRGQLRKSTQICGKPAENRGFRPEDLFCPFFWRSPQNSKIFMDRKEIGGKFHFFHLARRNETKKVKNPGSITTYNF